MRDNSQPQCSQRSSTYRISSTVAYLAGVGRRIFENEHEPPKLDVYQELEKDQAARIIRNLNMLRTAIEQNYTKILYESINEQI